jgi:hypothetical protein
MIPTKSLKHSFRETQQPEMTVQAIAVLSQTNPSVVVPIVVYMI